ncbi:MAG: dTMP kinase [Candidatus Dormibacteria bacterium]
MFITFEGPDGAGKSTQVALLAGALRDRGLSVVTVREPGGTAVGEAIRGVLLDGEHVPSPLAEALLYAAARAHLVTQVIEPALAAGSMVISDRFSDSSIAYQGRGRGLGVDAIAGLQQLATRGLRPDLTFLLDLDPTVGLARADGRSRPDRLEAAPGDFHDRVRQGFLELAAAEPERVVQLDAEQAPDRLAAQVLARVDRLLEQGVA